MKNTNAKKIKIFLVLMVIFLAAFLRLSTIGKLFVFTIDEEYLVDLAKTIATGAHPFKLIGVSVSVGVYLGALWTYFTAILLLISKYNILILGYASSLIGVLTTLMVFIVGQRMFSYRVGLVAGLLYAVSPLIVFFDQKYWNNTPIPLLSLTLLLSLYESRRNPKWWIVFAVALGSVFHTHLMLLPYIFLAIPLFLTGLKKVPGKITAFTILIFLIFISPLILFDATHNWTSLKAPLRFIQVSSGSGTGLDIKQRGQMMFQSLGRIWYLDPGSTNADEINWGCTSLSMPIVSKSVDLTSTRSTPKLWISAFSLLFLLWFLIRSETRKKNSQKLLALSLTLLLSAFLIFPGGALEYYLLGAFPLLVFVAALFLAKIKSRHDLILIITLTGFAALGFYTVSRADGLFGFSQRKQGVAEVMKIVGSEPFALEEYGGCQQYAGWRVFFESYGRRPSRSSIDSTLGWMYPDEIYKGPVKYRVAIRETRTFPNPVLSNNPITIVKGGYSFDVAEDR